MLIFGLRSTSDDWPGWSMDLNAIWHLSPAKKMKCSFLDYVQLLMMAGLVDGLEPHLPPLSSQNKMKCSFLDYIQLLMIGQAGQWTWMPSDASLQPKKWNAHFWITFNFWWSAEWPEWWTVTEMQKKAPLSHQKMKCSFSDGLPEDCQKTTRRLSEDHQKTSGSLLAVF